jgi:hypothetical protein
MLKEAIQPTLSDAAAKLLSELRTTFAEYQQYNNNTDCGNRSYIRAKAQSYLPLSGEVKKPI